MKKTIIVAFLLVASIGAGIAAITGLAGKWNGPLLTPDGNTSQVEYTFATDGAKLSGNVESAYGTAKIENGKLSGDEISFSINMNGLDLPHKGKVYPDSVTLNIDYNGMPLHVTLKRKL